MDLLDKDLSQAGSKVERSMQDISKRAGQVLSDIGSTATKAIGIGIGAVTAGVAAAGGLLLKLAKDAMPLENVSGAFAGIAGDADKMLNTLRTEIGRAHV